ncbi:(Fe-S)-binding protein [Arsenicibacter rosenii]|uniref:Fe-S oxidoreductase n=1 Tax=Arsenicibacter rosenii TaxID=1750698 RepID=A0A1S2VPQ2_9BACT|nr:(Fe-S)-binding protein [Arsenicibacter rosenii]OIN60732.1 Fe-S oxidoreductase [Arsenicibacter rosenii]
MRVGLFVPCYIDQFYPQVAIATLELLEKLGCEVVVPRNQTCCGQPMANSGFASLTGGCDQNFARNFAEFDYIVSPSGSCVLHVKEHNHLLKGQIYELCEFLTDVLHVSSLNARFPHKVGLHQSCHGHRGLRLASMSERNEKPFSKVEQLLNMVSGLEVAVPNRPDECCGFGGTFCVTEEAVSVKMGKDRIREQLNNNVEYIIGGDVSCLMHLEGILRRQSSPVQVKHIAEILNAD